jgi:hypothetical protein
MTLRELRELLTDEDQPLSKALLKATVAAALLKSAELKTFVEREYRGYGTEDPLPSFRIVPCSNLGTFQHGNMTASDQPIPTSQLQDVVRKYAAGHEVRESIPELEHSIKNGTEDNAIDFPWPQEFIVSVGEVNIGGYGLSCVYAHKIISVDSYVGIVSNVRHRLLDIVLALEEQFPNRDTEEQLQTIPAEAVTNIFQTFVQGDNANVAVGTSVQQVVQIKQGDLDALLTALEKLGVTAYERDALTEAIREDQKAGEKPGIGKRVGQWMAGLPGKAVEKGIEWGVVQAMPQIIALLHHYYGQ